MVYVIVRGNRKGRDASDVPPQHRILPQGWGAVRTPERAREVERAYYDAIVEARKKKTPHAPLVRKVASIPPELFFGKIRETGDKRYWDDKRNVKNHRECLIRPRDI